MSVPAFEHSARSLTLPLQRGTLLGEPAPPPVPKSVFDYLSAKAKERLASVTNPSSSTAPSLSAPAAPEPDAELHVPPLDGPTALAALKGFQPFSNSSTSPDPIRQKRYTLFLQLAAHLIDVKGSTLPFGPRQLPSGKTQTISELNRELQEYAQAAQVFKPVSGMLAGRFTSGGSGGLVPKVEPGLYQPPTKDPAAASGGLGSFAAAGLEPELVQKLTPAQEAARAGQWGEATRTAGVFRPAGLVCKRFGVKDPWKGVAEEDIGNEVGGAWKEAGSTGWSGAATSGGTKEALGQASMDALMQSSGFKKFQQPMYDEDPPLEDVDVPFSQDPTPSAPTKQVEKPTLESVGLGDDDEQGAETLTYTKAPRDIFAAIFADSDDDEDEEDEEDEPMIAQEAGPVKSAILPSSDSTSNPLPVASATDTTLTAPELDPEPEPDVSSTVLDTSTIADYRPSFVPTSSRNTNGSTSSATASSKKKKSSKRKAATLSFDVDEGDEGPAEVAPKKKKAAADGAKRKTRKEVKEDDEWAEAPSTVHPEILRATEVKGSEEKGAEAPGRSRASDLF